MRRGPSLVLLLLASASVSPAERRPVLRQIQVPHPYYYREMYLPQVTSGPCAPAWSPDGRALVFSMQGSLWLRPLDSDVAEQITDGPGYDFQPDWSPDGRSIVFASYRDDALEIELLDVATRTVSPVTSNHAANLEPRFSPDSARIAFVSTQDFGRWHVFVFDRASGALRRVSEDQKSPLPRYYYSPFDHYLSPVWSPDGTELLLVSNRGHAHGTGGIWRLGVASGSMREIRDEETTWRARPDWSRDGKTIVYASYLGRNFHQLWVMTPDGANPFPLTYGEFDSTSPRFSPDARHIAYTSNEEGDTSLVVLDLPGGARHRLSLKRQYLGPRATLTVEIRDAEGRSLPARVSLTGSDGRGYAPEGTWRHSDDSFDRSERRFEYTYFHSAGSSVLTVPPGDVTLEVARGLEYSVARRKVHLSAGEQARIEVRLARLWDLPARGWYSGDQHVHMNYAGSYRNDPGRLVAQALSEDLHVVESLIVNKEQRFPDLAFFDGGREDAHSTASTLLVHGQEYHTSYFGHLGLLGLQDHLLIPGYAAYPLTAASSPYPHNAAVARLARSQGALVGYVHPFDEYPEPSKGPITNELPVDAALGLVDYYEVVGFSDHLASARVWYELLNCGFRIPAGAGTDAMANFASLRGPVGLNRVFVKAPLRHGEWLAALKAGRTFATNGPLLEFTLAGREPGDVIHLQPGQHTLRAHARMASIVGVDHLEVVSGGEVVARVPLDEGGTSADATVDLHVRGSGWYTLRAWADGARAPVLDIYPFATTSPVYVEAGDPVHSEKAAAYFLSWLDGLEQGLRSHPSFRDEAERREVLQDVAAARKVFEARR